MGKHKVIEEYNEKYGDVPKDDSKLVSYVMDTITMKKQKINILNEMKRIQGIKWKTFMFTIYLVPKATPRPRYSSKGHMFYVKGSKDNKKVFYDAMKDMDFPIINTPMEFCCTSYIPTPQSMSKVDKVLAEMGFIRPISKPDFDNLAKTYADMISGLLIMDDRLIIEGTSKKYYSCKPRISIIIRYMEEYDCDFNKKKIERMD